MGNQADGSKVCRVVDLGRIAYGDACALQQRLVAARKSGATPDILLLCEHPHVLTLGRSGKIENLRASDTTLAQMGVEFHRSDRGGDITYHGPGQIVGYPILQLSEIRRDVGWYVRQLEETMIGATSAFGIAAFRVPRCTGVWVRPPVAGGSTSSAQSVSVSGHDGGATGNCAALSDSSEAEEKIGAIGVHISRWVTSHGFAYNVSTDMRYFDLIVPCGIANRRATSLEKLLGRGIAPADVVPHLVAEFGRAFGLQMVGAEVAEMDEWLETCETAATVLPAEP